VRVKDGAVELYGTITDERERTALRVLAENQPAVTAVRDHLVWIEPVSGFVIPAVGSEPPDKA
jgi:osmotically-inducible protein OsmY